MVRFGIDSSASEASGSEAGSGSESASPSTSSRRRQRASHDDDHDEDHSTQYDDTEEEDEMDEDEEDGPPRGSLFYSDPSGSDEDEEGYDDSHEVSVLTKRNNIAASKQQRLRPLRSSLSRSHSKSAPPQAPPSNNTRRRSSTSSSASSASSSSSPNHDRPVPFRRTGGSRLDSPAAASEHNAGPTPWPKTLKLEPKRVAVMQASLFQQQDYLHSRSPSAAPPAAYRSSSSALIPPSFTAPPLSFQQAPSNPPLAQPQPEAAQPIIDSTPFRPLRKYTRVALSDSVTNGHESSIVDAGLALGRSFRVGWGPNGELVRLGQGSDVIVQRFKEAAASEPSTPINTSTLVLSQSHTPIYTDSDSSTPFAVPHPELRFSHFLSLDSSSNTTLPLDASLWALGHALFDEITELPTPPDDMTAADLDRLTSVQRKYLLDAWVADAVRSEVEEDLRSLPSSASGAERAFIMLTGHQVERACMALLESGDVRLATLVAQAGGDGSFREDVYLQLAKWREYHIDAYVGQAERRILNLLCGNLGAVEGRKGEEIVDAFKVLEGKGWKRAFGCELWYGAFGGSIEDSVERYDAAVQRGVAETGVAPPLTPRGTTDPLWGLIKLFADPTWALEHALMPTNFGDAKMDYRLPWHLYILFSRVLRRRDFEDRIEVGDDMRDELDTEEEGVEGNSVRADLVTVAFADQLEREGEWVWSVFVLLHLELPKQRKSAIRNLISRSIHRLDDETFDLLTTSFKIPETWIFAAQALEKHYRGDVFAEFGLLLQAKLPAQAHKILRSQLAPEAVVRNELGLLRRLLQPFLDDTRIEGWSEGGQIYKNYADLMALLQSGNAASDVKSLLESLFEDLPLLGTGKVSDDGPELLDVCVCEMQTRLTVIARELGVAGFAGMKTLQVADKLICRDVATTNFWEEAIAGAGAV